MKVIYPNGSGGVAVIHPTAEYVGMFPTEGEAMDAVARKDVPEGVPYLIVPDDDIPSDRSKRAGWTADFSSPDGHGEPA